MNAPRQRERRPSSARANTALFGLVAALALLWASTAAASGPVTPVPGASAAEWYDREDREDDAPLSEFRWINYFFVRGTATNQVANPSGLKGVSLGPFGSIVGSETRVSRDAAYYVEQRWIPVVEYSPLFVDGLATFRLQFEVDFTWGRAANTVQQNEGGGFNADQINLQTKNVNVALYPTRKPHQLAVILGTQSFYDSVYDPTRTSLFDVVKTGYKLSYLGTDATGVGLYGYWKGHAKFSFIPLTGEPDAAAGDPRLSFAYLLTGDYSYALQPGTSIGLSLWHLRDDTKGDAYAYQGLVKAGPSSSSLWAFNGTPQFTIEKPIGAVTWLGLNFHHNIDFRTGPVAASGFVMYNGGRYVSTRENTTLNRAVDISGLGANLEVAWNYGRTNGDVVSLEGMYSTGDSDLRDGRYTGAFTLNNYGLPGAVWFNHKTLLLFPFTSTVSNYTGAVTDLSNQGYGLQAAILAASYDLIPNTLNLKLGAATAFSAVRPPDTGAGIPRGRAIGTEINAEVKYHLRYLMTVGVHGAYMFRGNFYNGNAQMTANPWAAFTTFTWYAF